MCNFDNCCLQGVLFLVSGKGECRLDMGEFLEESQNPGAVLVAQKELRPPVPPDNLFLAAVSWESGESVRPYLSENDR